MLSTRETCGIFLMLLLLKTVCLKAETIALAVDNLLGLVVVSVPFINLSLVVVGSPRHYLHSVCPRNFLSRVEDANRVRGCNQLCFSSVSRVNGCRT